MLLGSPIVYACGIPQSGIGLVVVRIEFLMGENPLRHSVVVSTVLEGHLL